MSQVQPERRDRFQVEVPAALVVVMVLSPFCSLGLLAQNVGPTVPPIELSSGIAALVGNEVITNAELDERTAHFRDELALSYPPAMIHREWQRLRRMEIDRLVEDKLVLQLVAREESKSKAPYVSEQAIDEELTRRVEDLRKKGLVLQDAEDLYAFYRKTYGMKRSAVRKRLRERMSIARYFWQEVFPGISNLVKPKEARYYYHDHLDLFTTPVEISFRMIVISRGRVDAAEAVLKVEQGIKESVDFPTLASHYSDEAVLGNRRRARDKIWKKSFKEIQEWTAPIPDVLRTMKPGEVSDRVETPQRLHFFKIEDVVSGSPRSFRDVQQAIEAEILAGRRQQARRDFIARLRARTRIEILSPELRDVSPAEVGNGSETDGDVGEEAGAGASANAPEERR